MTMHYSNLQSIVSGALPHEHVEDGLRSQGERTYEVEVPGRTLTSVLDEATRRDSICSSWTWRATSLRSCKGWT